MLIGLEILTIATRLQGIYFYCLKEQFPGSARNSRWLPYQRQKQRMSHSALQFKKQHGYKDHYKIYSQVSAKEPTVIFEDNQGAIAIAKNPVSHSRTKHIDIKYHYVREAVQSGIVNLKYCPTEEMIADILTKPLTKGKFTLLRTKMGLQPN